MKTECRMTVAVMVCLMLTISACSGGPSSSTLPTQAPTANAPAHETVGVTAEAVLQNPTSTTSAPIGSALRESEILEIVRSSLAAYPWRMDQSVFAKGTGQTRTSRTEVQSSTRSYNQSLQTVGTETIIIESILIDSMLYLKITGSLAETYGLVDGQWAELSPTSPLAQLADTSAVDPAKIAEIFAADFASLSGQSGADEMLFEAVGSEDVDGNPTTIYESKGETFTYRWWIGADRRFYKTTVDLPEATRTILIDYNTNINIQPPIP